MTISEVKLLCEFPIIGWEELVSGQHSGVFLVRRNNFGEKYQMSKVTKFEPHICYSIFNLNRSIRMWSAICSHTGYSMVIQGVYMEILSKVRVISRPITNFPDFKSI